VFPLAFKYILPVIVKEEEFCSEFFEIPSTVDKELTEYVVIVV
jgi:hypothetical protein